MYKAIDYIMALDMDEFLVVHVGDSQVSDLMEALPPFECALINWKMLGSGAPYFLDRVFINHRVWSLKQGSSGYHPTTG